MVVTTAILAAVALVIADVAGLTLLRSGLVSRVDAQLEAQARGLSRVGQRPPPGIPRTPRPSPGFGSGSRVYLYASDGTRLYASPSSTADEPRLDNVAALEARAGDRPFTVDGTEGAWRVKVVEVPSGRDATGHEYAVHAVSLHAIDVTAQTLLLVDAAVTALVIVLIAVAAGSVVRIGLRPLTSMEKIATEIAGGDLSRRVPDADPHTESGRLGTALNTMLVRIEAALADRTASERRLRQFLADASHELRTPLTSIQGFAELYRRGGAPPGPALDEAMGRIEAEVGRMRLLVNDLLLLARLDEERPLERSPVDLLAVAADAVRDAHVRVPSRFVQLAALDDTSDTFEAVTVLGDESRIRQVVTNLLANALQHTPDSASVAVRVGRATTGGADPAPLAVVGADLPAGVPAAAVEVSDTGPGMNAEDARHVFERLYRADASRSRRHGGAGLGLAIVAAIVQAHGGRVELYTAPGAGARFRVLLPTDVSRLPASSEEMPIAL
ncbi:HAMP domain-containing histidine kinase [Planosporangium thailandense]|uniref:histidine kinase n=1 Tax=Planosporangium thailandense TaxID=765197 RepID=A0ABX0Y0Y8_9ACTN|nr:HAMP domain-containing sensor histidine kinase [Planosporangium thailandense]NJC71703.1 HAMP domain-containing histidine kinase [Planosporangium thailandense]